MNAIVNELVGAARTIPAVFNEDFPARAKRIIEQHIKSAVLIDDDWPQFEEQKEIIESTESYSETEKEVDVDLPEEQAEGIFENELVTLSTNAGSIAAIERNIDKAKRLLKIQECFIKKGIICTGFKYTAEGRRNAPRLAKNADIVILDWNFAGDSGAGAVEILKELKDGQLRFVCIFTDQTDLVSVKKRILTEVCGVEYVDATIDFKAENFVFTLRNKAVDGAESENKSAEEDLFDHAIEHLSAHYCGFLQLAMLELTSRHRGSLLSHLVRLSPEYDAALLSESSLEHSPIDMASNLRELLIDEWRIALEASAEQSEMTILGISGRAAYAAKLKQNLPNVTAKYLQSCASALGLKVSERDMELFFQIRTGETRRSFDIDVGAWLDNGAVGQVPLPQGIKKNDVLKMSVATFYALSHTGDTTKEPTQEEIYKYVFKLDALFNQQQILPGELTQGTILKFNDENYLICITPLCDTVRLGDQFYSYSFLGATKAKTEEMLMKKSPYCVFVEEGQPVCLHVDVKRPFVYEVGPAARKLQLSKAIEMRPRLLHRLDNVNQPDAPAGGNSRNDTFSVKVVGQLRTDFFLMLTAASAANASRVGVNRMEFIRLHKD